MKTYFKYFMSMAAAVVALSSCQKEIESKDAPAKEKGVLSITVKATQEALKSEAGTKTYIDGTSVFWGTGEYMKIGVFDGEGTAWGTSNDESADLWNSQQQALFEFSITPKTESGTYTYYGMYPASAAATSSNNDPATYKVNLPAAQNATASSYDPKAYILVAQPDGGHDAVMTDWDAAFRRATALNKITLKNLPEDIKRVSITAPENVKLAGGRHINLTTGQSDDIYSGVNKIDVKFDAPQATGSDVVVWFTSWDAEIPVDANLTIVAYSTAHTFTRTLTVANKSITFKEGCLNTLNVNMSSADQGDNTELEPGDYVVLAKNNTTYYAMKAEVTGTGTSTRMVSVDYTGSLDSYNGDGDIVWTIENTGSAYTIKNGSNYLGWTSGNYAAFVAEESYSDEVCLMDITYNEGTYLISSNSDSERKLARNTSNAYFAFYAGTQYKDIVFVPATVDTRSDVTLAFEDAVVNLTTSDYDQFFGQEDVTATPSVEAVTNHLEWSYTDPNGIIDEFDNGALLLNGKTGTATVTVSFAGDENYRPAEASYTINVTDGGIPTVSYEKVTSAPADWSGDYLLVCENRGEALSSISTTSTKYGIGAAVTISNDAIESSATVDAYKIVIAAATGEGSGYTLRFGDDYLFWSSGNSLATNATESDNTRWTITEGATAGNWIIANVKDSAREIWYNTSSPRFACYTGKSEASAGYAAIQLYKYASAPDTRQEAGMSWSAEAATATFNTGNTISFTAPSLDQGNASAVTYESTDANIATIDENTGEVTIAALNENVVTEGSTTIKAVFAGDDNYKPQTVSYTLTVADGRAQVPTPSFDTPEGEVTAGTDVAFECELDEVNFHYTVNGTTPTVDSPIGTSVVIDEPMTVKIIAEKLGYKPSEVASATYTISGVQPHDGSLEYPYTASEARDLALNGDTGTYYITGTVTKVQNQFSAGYGTANFWIDENGVAEDVFEGYKIKYFDDVAWVEGNRLMEVGDVVIINGTLTVYKSSIAETSSGHLVSINGTTKGLHAGSLSASPDNDNKQITVTWGAATGTDSAVSYAVTCGDQNYNASAAGSHTFTMADYGSYDVSVVATAADAFSATATTTAILSDPSSGGDETTEEITTGTFSGDANSLSMTTTSGITISQLKNGGTNCNTNYNTVSTLRVYRANQIQFTGKTFKKVEMYYTGTYSGASWTVANGGGTVTIDTSNKKVVWENTGGATTVTLQNSTASGTNTQLRTTKFVITYE
ncbi:MAG: chitobiase/beta-hexosaminidase C-terminal domain-containing protein [Bacteroidales bacterium]|nr:chitobiase/beta-hexosaminidase C-terminal domain-containing protein [Bacteroidales bacterium]